MRRNNLNSPVEPEGNAEYEGAFHAAFDDAEEMALQIAEKVKRDPGMMMVYADVITNTLAFHAAHISADDPRAQEMETDIRRAIDKFWWRATEIAKGNR